jgi:hypothetical protein
MAASRSTSLREIVAADALDVGAALAAMGTASVARGVAVIAGLFFTDFPADALRFAILPPYSRLDRRAFKVIS